jgi:hypothetical protein
MQYYDDSHITDRYLHYQHDTLETYTRGVAASMPFHMRALAAAARRMPAVRRLVESRARALLETLAREHGNSPLNWYLTGNEARVQAFYGGAEAFEAIPDWGEPMPDLDPGAPWRRFDHGYDETKPILGLDDLQQAAEFRGGRCLADQWAGDPYTTLDWVCSKGHAFSARPYTVLGAGHWCPVCVEDWNGHERAAHDRHYAQSWYADHEEDERYDYSTASVEDIRDADVQWRNRRG